MMRIELTTFCPPDKRANQAALHPDLMISNILFFFHLSSRKWKFLWFFTQISHNFSKNGYFPWVWTGENWFLKKWFCQIFIFDLNCHPKSNRSCSPFWGGGGLFSAGNRASLNNSEIFLRLHNIPLTKVYNLRKDCFHSAIHPVRHKSRYANSAVQICYFMAFSLVPRKSASCKVCLISLKNTAIPHLAR